MPSPPSVPFDRRVSSFSDYVASASNSSSHPAPSTSFWTRRSSNNPPPRNDSKSSSTSYDPEPKPSAAGSGTSNEDVFFEVSLAPHQSTFAPSGLSPLPPSSPTISSSRSKFSFGSRRPSQGPPRLTPAVAEQLQRTISNTSTPSSLTVPSTKKLRIVSPTKSTFLFPLPPTVEEERQRRTELHRIKQRERRESAQIESLIAESAQRAARRESENKGPFRVGRDSPPVPALPPSFVSVKTPSFASSVVGEDGAEQAESERNSREGTSGMDDIDAWIEKQAEAEERARRQSGGVSKSRSKPSSSPSAPDHQPLPDKYTHVPPRRSRVRRPSSLSISFVPEPDLPELGSPVIDLTQPPSTTSSASFPIISQLVLPHEPSDPPLPPAPRRPSSTSSRTSRPRSPSLSDAFELDNIDNLSAFSGHHSKSRRLSNASLAVSFNLPPEDTTIYLSASDLSPRKTAASFSSQPHPHETLHGEDESDEECASYRALDEAIEALNGQDRRPSSIAASLRRPSFAPPLSNNIIDAGSRRPSASGHIALPLTPPAFSEAVPTRSSWPRRMSRPRSLASLKGSRFDGEGSASLLEDLEAQQEQEKPEEGGEQELQPAGWDGEELSLTRKCAHLAILIPYSMLGLLVRWGMLHFIDYTNPSVSALVWSQGIGCAIFGLVIGKRHELTAVYPPLFTGLAIGFAESITSFSGWMLSAFSGFSNLTGVSGRGGMENAMEGISLLLLTLLVAHSSLSLGIYLSSLLPSFFPSAPGLSPSPSHPRRTTTIDRLIILSSLLLYALVLIAYFVLTPSRTSYYATELLLPMIFAPAGCLLRFVLGKLNPWLGDLGGRRSPWGTLGVNVLGCVVLAVTWVFQRVDSMALDGTDCAVMYALQVGFAGTLSSVGFFMLELRSPGWRTALSRWAYLIGTIFIGQAIMVGVVGGVQWSGVSMSSACRPY